MKRLPKALVERLPKAIVKKLPKTFQGATVKRGLGMGRYAFDALERNAMDTFDATRDMWLVIDDRVFEDLHPVVCSAFNNEAAAVRYARALSNGNVDHRVLYVTAQTLVVATENEL